MRLSAFILANMEPILKDWEDFARSLGDVTSLMDTKALRDHAELILRAVAADLETPQSPAQQEAKSEGDAPARAGRRQATAAQSHGTVRAEEGFSLEEMVSEYRALRATVLRLWAQVQTTPDADSFQQLMRFNEAIDEALADSIKTYSSAVDQMAITKARSRMEALGTLSAGLGHDMGNVLVPIRMCLRTITDKGLSDETAPLMEALRRAFGHLDGLSKGLRALSMDPTNSAGSPDSTLLHEWWTSAISPFTWSLPPGVRLHAEGLSSDSSPLPPVHIPAHVLMQAVFNLVQNAGQALGQKIAANPFPSGHEAHDDQPAGNIWITAELEPSPPSGAPPSPNASPDTGPNTGPDAGQAHAVRLTVRDDGPGMDTATAARCTEPFFTTKAKDLGMGLGMYLVRSAIERHGGRLLIESNIGQGTAFTLILPAARTPTTPTPTTPNSAARTTQAAGSHR